MKLDRATLKLAAQLSERYRADYEAYRESCEIDRRNGYRPAYCEHGTSQWVDYDPICGGCENGMTMRDPIQRRQRAIEDAKCRVAEARRVLDLVAQADRLGLAEVIDMAGVWKRVDKLFEV